MTVIDDRLRTLADLPKSPTVSRAVLVLLCCTWIVAQLGCEVDSYFDPSRTGRFMHTPTTIPILERIDAIEEDVHPWGETTEATPDDLLPSDLTYVISPGDWLTVEVFESFAFEQLRPITRRVDAAGNFRIPDIGDVQAAGLTPQELEDRIRERMQEFLVEPYVNVLVDDATAFTFTLEGFIAGPGMYRIQHPAFRLSEAMAIAGGLPQAAKRVYVIRRIPLVEEVMPLYERDPWPDRDRRPAPRPEPPIDIEDLIEDLEDRPRTNPAAMSSGSSMSAFSGRTVPIDVDDLQPVRVPDQPDVDIDETIDRRERERREQAREMFIYDQERGEWVRTFAPQRNDREPARRTERRDRTTPTDVDEPRLLIERIIEIPAPSIRKGVGRYDIVLRPKDRVVVEGPEVGTIYISGEINRPGVFNLPQDGGRLTLSRAIAAAGDLGGLAIPERVDLVRKVGPNREATVRLDLAAIRRRTEPDIYLKPDDHIIIGTSWFATPLAVIRNGFRATYGFGFLLDRNFGTDVFGVPPGQRGFGGF